jgi:PAS domain S-box-containing protein
MQTAHGTRAPASRDDEAQLARYRRIFEASIDAIVVIDAQGRITGFNPAAEVIFGCPKSESLGRELAELLIPARHRESHRDGLARLVETGRSGILNRRVRVDAMRADGSEFPAELIVTQIDESPLRFAAFVRDITEERRQERQLEDLARDNAQIINSAGDGIYRVDRSGRITYANPAAAYLLGCDLDEMMGRRAHDLMHHSHASGSPYPVEDCPVAASWTKGTISHVTTEVFWRADGTSFPVDYTSAPIREKGEIVGAVCIFADISEQRAREMELRERADWTRKVHTALRDDRLVLHGQPIFPARGDFPAMHELLLRMRSANDSLVMPADFLPQAERFELMATIDHWVLSQGISMAARQPVSVNVSAQALSEDGFADSVLDLIGRQPLDPSNLVLEITETTAFEDPERAVEATRLLTDIGCRLALDDFGTGYGNFAELSMLPVSYLKIDSAFVSGITDGGASLRSVQALVSVAGDFGLETIAEGVESEAAVELLLGCGVDYLQGFHLGRPGPIE